MRKFLVFLASVMLAGCGGDGLDGPGAPTQCSNDNQKQYVLDGLYYWYLWNDMLPANISIADYPSPEVLVYEVTRTYGPQQPAGGPLDRFSSVGSAQADQQYYGEGKYEGFGFGWLMDGADMRFSQVFEDSPAFAAGFGRGQTVLRIDGRTIAEINANEGINAALDQNTAEFEIQNLDLTTFTVVIAVLIATALLAAVLPARRALSVDPIIVLRYE